MKRVTYLLVFIIAVVMGGMFTFSRARASSPIGEISSGSVGAVYDEHWTATSALVKVNSGANVRWQNFSAFNNDTPNSRAPKMVVTKWRVHGHIHFP